MENALEDRIRRHAYFLWLDNGGAGDPTYFWLIAERAVLAEVEMEAATDAQLAEAGPDTAAQRLARRVNALVLLASGSTGEEADVGVAAE